MSVLLLRCWYRKKINTFYQKMYLEALLGLALACITSSFVFVVVVVVLNSQKNNHLFSIYIERPVITRLRTVSLFSLDLVREKNACASVEREARNEGSSLSRPKSRTWSFACLTRFARRNQKEEQAACSLGLLHIGISLTLWLRPHLAS